MGVCPKTPVLARTPDDASAAPSEITPVPAMPAAVEPVVHVPTPQSPEERAARQAITRHRQRLDWAMHLPEFEPFFAKA